MGYWVENGIQELKDWEQRIYSLLSEILPPDKISYYLDEYQLDILGLYERAIKGEGIFTLSIYNAIASISQIRDLPPRN